MQAVLTLASLGLLVWPSDLCPPACRCLYNLTTVMCPEKGLEQIPELPEGTEKLYIPYNQIQEVPESGLDELQV